MAYSAQTKTKPWTVAAVVGVPLVAVVAGLGWMINLAKDSNADKTVTGEVVPISDTDYTRGNPASNVSLIEYGDFQCPACEKYEGVLSQLLSERSNDIYFSFRYFPLKSHNYGSLSAFAAEAAGRQGKFWEMHDLLYAKQTEWSTAQDARSIFRGYAQSIGLDVAQWSRDLDSEEVKSVVARQLDTGLKAGVGSTPTFFLNGKRVEPVPSIEAFTKLIDEAKASAGQ